MTRNPSPGWPARASILRRLLRQTDGNVSVLTAALGIPLLIAIGIGVDTSRAIAMKAALQADVDTAALSGAAAAFGTTTQTGSSTDTPSAVGQSFYTREGRPLGLNPTAPGSVVTTSGTTATAVTVTASAQVQVDPIFLQFWTHGITVGATAKAVAGSPSAATGTFPFALPTCTFDDNWNTATGQPIIDPATGLPKQVTLHSIQDTSKTTGCSYGQWTSLTTDDNSQSFVKGLINNGCGCTLHIGDNIYIQPGAKAASFGDAAVFDGKIVLMAVVSSPDNNITTKQQFPISTFAPFFIQSTDQGGKTITGHFVANFHGGGLSGASGSPSFGAVTVTLSQ